MARGFIFLVLITKRTLSGNQDQNPLLGIQERIEYILRVTETFLTYIETEIHKYAQNFFS